MRIQYEEKTFEGYFNVELANSSDIYFPIGQVQEGSIGADAVALTRNRWLWRRLGYPYWLHPKYRGLPFREIAEEMEIFLEKEIANIPDISANIFFQYKRSEYLVTSQASEWAHWMRSYFRYDIYPRQQALLEHLNTKFQKSVLILYAAPAVKGVNELVDYYCNRKIISNTNFRPAADLTGHARNTFIDAGTHSWACSEPIRHEHFDLLENLREQRSFNQTNSESIVSLSKGVGEVLLDSPLGKAFSALVERYEILQFERPIPLLNAHIVMAAFRELTGIQWVAYTPSPREG